MKKSKKPKSEAPSFTLTEPQRLFISRLPAKLRREAAPLFPGVEFSFDRRGTHWAERRKALDASDSYVVQGPDGRSTRMTSEELVSFLGMTKQQIDKELSSRYVNPSAWVNGLEYTYWLFKKSD